MTDKLLIGRAVVQQALEALIVAWQQNPRWQITESMHALRAALAQQPEPAQEPVAWMVYTEDGKSVCVTDNPNDLVGAYRALPLYTAPPQRPPLTDEEMRKLWSQYGYKSALCMRFARAIERKVRGEA